MIRCPNSREMDIMRQLVADGHGIWRTEFPMAILNDCISSGWVREDDHGFVFITDAGRQMHEVRK